MDFGDLEHIFHTVTTRLVCCFQPLDPGPPLSLVNREKLIFLLTEKRQMASPT